MKPQTKGVVSALGAYLMWGTLPLYLHTLKDMPKVALLSHRIVWSVVLLAGTLTAMRDWPAVIAAVRTRRTLAMLAASAVLIAVNWFTFLWCNATNQYMQASMGYYITPLFSAMLGMAVLGERLRPAQAVSLAMAGAGVAWLAFATTTVPTAALILAVSFSLYGLLRKLAPVGAVPGLAIETAILFPAAVAYLLWFTTRSSPFNADAAAWFATRPDSFAHPSWALGAYIALGAGTFTTVPLLLFAIGARRLPLTTMAFLQFVGPTCQLVLSVAVFHEKFKAAHAVTFALIWGAVGVFCWDVYRRNRASRLPGFEVLPVSGRGA